MILIIIAIVLIAGAVILCIELNTRKSLSAYDYIAEAERLINSREYNLAVDKCAEGLKNFPREPELYLKKAQAYMQAGDETKALQTLEYGIKQTQSGLLSDYMGENFSLSETENSFFGVADNAEYSAPDNGGENNEDSSDAVEYNTPYPKDDSIIVDIPTVTLPPASSSEISDNNNEEDESEDLT